MKVRSLLEVENPLVNEYAGDMRTKINAMAEQGYLNNEMELVMLATLKIPSCGTFIYLVFFQRRG